MKEKTALHGLLSLTMAGVLLFSCAVPGYAAQLTETTVPAETVQTETVPAAVQETTVPQTEPRQTETQPQETETATEPPVTRPQEAEGNTQPTQTQPTETRPQETETGTEPSETQPEETECIAETQSSTEPTETEPLQMPLRMRMQPKTGEWSLYFGLLHAHTEVSGSQGTVEEAFAYASGVEGLDFFAVTDYSHTFDNAGNGGITQDGAGISQDWAAGRAAAAAVTGGDFVGLYGYEMAWKDNRSVGHMNTFGTPGWQSRNQKEFDSSKNYYKYYDALTTVPGSVSQFNHPEAEFCFKNFKNRSEAYDAVINLLEVGSGDGISTKYYDMALKQGWHVAPTNNQNNHNGKWGDAGSGRTVVLAKELTEESLYEAMNARRVYATEDADLRVWFTLNGAIMGSVTGTCEEAVMEVTVQDPTDEGPCKVEVFTDTGVSILKNEKPIAAETMEAGTDTLQITVSGSSPYYYLKITQPDGDTAVTAPVWMEEGAEEPPDPPRETAKPAEPEETAKPTDPEETTKPTDPEEAAKPTDPEETAKPTEPEETTFPSEPEETQPPCPPPEDMADHLYFGQLHAHTSLSDGLGTVEEAFAGAAKAEHMDFFAVTDHSNSFDNDDSGAIGQDGTVLSTKWASGKAAARAATTDAFLGIFGYEMTWQEDKGLGHINTFNTPGWHSRNQEGFSSLQSYYEALTTVPGSVSQFNHPGPEYGEFQSFAHYSAAYDRAISLLEVGGEGDFTAYDYYTQALDAGWHVAPTNSENRHRGRWDNLGSARTVVLAESLTEQSLYEAMGARRVYATEDADLSIYYRLDGAVMGDITGTGNSHEITVWLSDPTDAIGRVEVITDGGQAIAGETVDTPSANLTMTVPGGKHYYYLKITQPDGDIAVTAPVWTDDYADMGVASFTADSQLPVQGKTLNLSLELYNEETVDFRLTSLECHAGEQLIYTRHDIGTVAAGDTFACSFPYTHPGLGITRFRLVARGIVDGKERSYEKTLTISYRAEEMVSGILVDGSHSGLKLSQLDNLTALAEEVHMDVTLFTGEMPKGGEILIVPAPEGTFDTDYVNRVAAFVKDGGSVILCGAADAPEAVSELNRLLTAAGSTMKFRADTAVDRHHNGGSEEELHAAVFNTKSSWCGEVTEEQFFTHTGCTVDPGNGTWLVKGSSTSRSTETGAKSPVLLACEKTACGGTVFASGSLFLSDDAMPLPKNRWDAARINQTVLEALLGIERTVLPLASIKDVREGTQGKVYRIKGHTTSGTSNKYNTFPDTIYLQDDTGGIAVVSFEDRGIQVGVPLEVIGYRDSQYGNLVLELIDYRVLEEDMYRYVPETLNHSRAMDYKALGGSLIQVEAEVTAVTCTEDGKGVSRFTLTDAWGDEAVVKIQDYIFSGACGTNTLATQVQIGRTVRAMGLLHLDGNGVPVVRVRNCEEVVYVPPFPKPGENPYTGDGIAAVLWAGAASAAGLTELARRKRKKQSR